MTDLVQFVFLPIGLGLIGFVEPCSIGSTLLFIKYLEGMSAAEKLLQVGLFTVTRSLSIGLLGAFAVVVGAAFVNFQKGAWIMLGVLYVALGLLFLLRRGGWLKISLGPSLARISGARGSVALGLLFGMNIPLRSPLDFCPSGHGRGKRRERRNLDGRVPLARPVRLRPIAPARYRRALRACPARARPGGGLVAAIPDLDRSPADRSRPLVDLLWSFC